jgi:integrase
MPKEKSTKSTSYKIFRYFTPSSIPAEQTAKNKSAAARKRYMIEPLTYKSLLEAQDGKLRMEGLNPQTAANRATALRKFMASNFLHLDDVVGSEMRMNHPSALERFVANMRADGKSTRAISNTLSALRHWKQAVVQHDIVTAQTAERASPFVEALRSVLNGQNVALVARQATIPKDMLYGWLRGKLPRAANVKYISRLETFFGLERHSLIQLSGAKPIGRMVAGGGGETKPIVFRNLMGEITRTVFRVKPGPDSPLRAQWGDFLIYKTAATLSTGSGNNVRSGGKKRTRRGKWRVSPCPLTAQTDNNWWAFLPVIDATTGNETLKEVASAKINWSKVSAYLGWLRLDPEVGGMGLPPHQVETFGWLAHPEFLERYLDWTKDRVKARNKGALQFLAFVGSLVRPEAGYLRQTPEFAETLPEQYRWANWSHMCDETFELTQQLVAAYDDELQVSRDSFEPIMHILQLPQPMDAIADMIQRMRAARPIGNPKDEAVWARDLVLIKLLASNPVRSRNLAHMTWRADNTGELHQRDDKSWWLKIHRTKFKNTRGAAGDREFYECQVNPSAWTDIEKYIRLHRPILMRGPTDLFFLTAHNGYCRNTNPDSRPRPWVDLGGRVHELTARYLYRCAGVGCHSFRHIVATSILKAPGGDFKTAALVLYDRIATVEKHYAFLTASVGGDRMAELLASSFRRM